MLRLAPTRYLSLQSLSSTVPGHRPQLHAWFPPYSCSRLLSICEPLSLSLPVVSQAEQSPDAMEACGASHRCHTATRSPSNPVPGSVEWSVAITRRCLCRWTLRQLSDTVWHEQPTQHEPPTWRRPPQSSLTARESLHYQTLYCWKSFIVRDNRTGNDGRVDTGLVAHYIPNQQLKISLIRLECPEFIKLFGDWCVSAHTNDVNACCLVTSPQTFTFL